MSIPSVPKRSRVSGEKTFLLFFPLGNADSHIKSIDILVQDGFLAIYTTDIFTVQRYFVLNPQSAVSTFRITQDLGGGLYKTDIPFHGPEDHIDVAFIGRDELLVTGQATDISGSETPEFNEIKSIANDTIKDVDVVSIDVNLALFVDDEVNVGKLLGYETLPSQIKIDRTKDYHALVVLEAYSSGNPATAQYLFSTVYTFVRWESLNPTATAGKQSYQTWDITGKAKDKYILTEN